MYKSIKVLITSSLLFISLIANAQTTAEIQQLADQGNALGQAKLASLYILGWQGVVVDDRQAAKWMKKSAEQGLVDAQVVVAAMYESGLGVTVDIKKATQWYEKAAKQGHGASLALLGKNPTAKGSVQFNYKKMRSKAAQKIPEEYAKRILKNK